MASHHHVDAELSHRQPTAGSDSDTFPDCLIAVPATYVASSPGSQKKSTEKRGAAWYKAMLVPMSGVETWGGGGGGRGALPHHY